MKVRIDNPEYGIYTTGDKEYLNNHIGEVVSAELRNINYYMIEGKHLLHIYDCSPMPIKSPDLDREQDQG